MNWVAFFVLGERQRHRRARAPVEHDVPARVALVARQVPAHADMVGLALYQLERHEAGLAAEARVLAAVDVRHLIVVRAVRIDDVRAEDRVEIAPLRVEPHRRRCGRGPLVPLRPHEPPGVAAERVELLHRVGDDVAAAGLVRRREEVVVARRPARAGDLSRGVDVFAGAIRGVKVIVVVRRLEPREVRRARERRIDVESRRHRAEEPHRLERRAAGESAAGQGGDHRGNDDGLDVRLVLADALQPLHEILVRDGFVADHLHDGDVGRNHKVLRGCSREAREDEAVTSTLVIVRPGQSRIGIGPGAAVGETASSGQHGDRERLFHASSLHHALILSMSEFAIILPN